MSARKTCILGLFTLMAGCTQPAPGPAPLTLDPVLNKYDGGGDGGGCAGGQTAGAASHCLPVPDPGTQRPRPTTQLVDLPGGTDPGRGQGAGAGGGGRR